MKGPILYFFLLVLGIPINLGLDIDYKQVGFSKALLEKSLEFVPGKGGNSVTLNLSLVLLLMEVDSILKK